MKNPAPYIRQKLVDLLSTITYNDKAVPVHATQGEVLPYQIYLGDTTDTPIDNRDGFTGRWEQVIEVISEGPNSVHRHVDSIAESILITLKPSPRASPFTGNDVFQIGAVKKEGQRYRDEPSGEGTFINRLIIRISFLVTQINNN